MDFCTPPDFCSADPKVVSPSSMNFGKMEGGTRWSCEKKWIFKGRPKKSLDSQDCTPPPHEFWQNGGGYTVKFVTKNGFLYQILVKFTKILLQNYQNFGQIFGLEEVTGYIREFP